MNRYHFVNIFIVYYLKVNKPAVKTHRNDIYVITTIMDALKSIRTILLILSFSFGSRLVIANHDNDYQIIIAVTTAKNGSHLML